MTGLILAPLTVADLAAAAGDAAQEAQRTRNELVGALVEMDTQERQWLVLAAALTRVAKAQGRRVENARQELEPYVEMVANLSMAALWAVNDAAQMVVPLRQAQSIA